MGTPTPAVVKYQEQKSSLRHPLPAADVTSVTRVTSVTTVKIHVNVFVVF